MRRGSALGSMAPGVPTVASVFTTSSVARPVRGRPCTFWNATTAWCVVRSKVPSTLPTS